MGKWFDRWGLSPKNKMGLKEVQAMDSDNFLLIDGVFSPEQAADVLLSLLNYKIKYHSVHLQDTREADYDTVPNSKKRLEELKATKNKITKIIVETRDKGKHLNIRSAISISKID